MSRYSYSSTLFLPDFHEPAFILQNHNKQSNDNYFGFVLATTEHQGNSYHNFAGSFSSISI